MDDVLFAAKTLDELELMLNNFLSSVYGRILNSRGVNFVFPKRLSLVEYASQVKN